MKSVFADSFYFFALLNPRDPAHARAVAFTGAYTGRLVTTGWVLTELADGWARPAAWRSAFVQLLADVRANPAIAVEPCTNRLLDEGMHLDAQRPDKEWSLTDCISFVVMGAVRHHRGVDRRPPFRASRFRGLAQIAPSIAPQTC